MKRKILIPTVFLLAVSGLIFDSSLGTSVQEVNLEDMVRNADRIFWGQCISVETLNSSEYGMEIRQYKFRVVEGLKGVESGQALSIRQVYGFPGGQVAGIPHYQKGQQVLLFLHGDSRLGLTSPVGMYQGTFRVVKLKDGETAFINSVENRNLAKGFGTRSASSLGVTVDEMDAMKSGQPLRLSDFEALVSKINMAIQ